MLKKEKDWKKKWLKMLKTIKRILSALEEINSPWVLVEEN